MPLIFVSYRRTDASGHAGRLYDRLVDRFGEANVFKDVDSTEPGADFVEVIKETVGRCDALLAVIGRDWLGPGEPGSRRLDDPQDWVRVEIGDALHRKIRVVPVLVEGASMPSRTDLPDELEALARRQAFELTESSWNAQVAQLIDRLESAGRARTPAPVAPPPPDTPRAARGPAPGERAVARAKALARRIDPRVLAVCVIALLAAAVGAATILGSDDPSDTRTFGVSISQPGRTARVNFDGRAGERVSFAFEDVTIGGGGENVMAASILDPKGQEVGATPDLLNLDDDVIDAQTLPVTGTYTLLVDPDGANTGKATVTMHTRPAGDDGDLAPGRARTVAIDGVGQTARLTFAGREGERVSFGFEDVTIGGGGPNVMSASILDPKGQQVGESSNVLGLDDDVIEALTLPATGTYTLVVDPDDTNTGKATVTLHSRPAGDDGRLEPGQAVTVAIEGAGQTARLTFAGREGERVSFGFEDVTIGGGGADVMAASILDPKGERLDDSANLLGIDGDVIDALPLPATGIYTLVIDPDDAGTGKAAVALHSRPAGDDGELVAGRARRVAIDGAGQTARLTFSGQEGERVSFRFEDVTIGGGGDDVMSALILDPKGERLDDSADLLGIGGDAIAALTLPKTGTYTLVVDPDGTNTGKATVRLRRLR